MPPLVHLAAVLTSTPGGNDSGMIHGAPVLMPAALRPAGDRGGHGWKRAFITAVPLLVPPCWPPWPLLRSQEDEEEPGSGMRMADGRGDEADNGSAVLLHWRGRATAVRERERSHTEGKRRYLKLNVRTSIW